MAQRARARKLTSSEIQFLQEAISADHKICSIRLREGEYQYDLAKTITFFQLELYFPDVKDIVRRSYGTEKTNDTQFIRKIQTILKKMEKNSVLRILPKKKSWQLQRYALSSFKFEDADKNLIILATDQQLKQMQSLLHSILRQQETRAATLVNTKTKVWILLFVIVASYTAILWALLQPTINPIVFIPAFSIAVACSLMVGKMLSQE